MNDGKTYIMGPLAFCALHSERGSNWAESVAGCIARSCNVPHRASQYLLLLRDLCEEVATKTFLESP